MTFKICHIGCGGMSERGHGPALNKYRNDYIGTELTACCDIDAGKAERFSHDHGFAGYYSDWKEMLGKEHPDAVSLVVPVLFTSKIAAEILEMGYNLTTEKPPGMTFGECRGIIKAAETSKAKLGVMFNRRYMPLVKETADILKGREIEYLRYDFYRTGRNDKDFSTTAIHGIDAAQMLAGGLYSEMSFLYQSLKTNSVGNIFASGVTDMGTRVELNFYPDSGMNAERVVIISEGSTFFINIPIWDCPDYPGSIQEFRGGKLVSEMCGERTEMFISSGFYDEHRDFYESIRSNGKSPADMQQHLISVRIMESIRYRSNTFLVSA